MKIGEPDENAPVLITSNWALTYFIVYSAIEATKIPSFSLCKRHRRARCPNRMGSR
jgi:acetyl-CoA decarbonylase/synthase complex subunit gamma